MAVDLLIVLENRPGTLADLGEAAAAAGVNLEGGCGFPCEGRGVGHVLVEDPSAADTLRAAGFDVGAPREVLVIPAEDRPGVLGEICRRIADAGANIDLLYIASNNRLVLGVDDLERARAALG